MPNASARAERSFAVLRALAIAVLAVLLLPYLIAPLYRFIDPVSTLMLWRRMTGAPWCAAVVPLAASRRSCRVTVIASEDGRFCAHRGIDWRGLREAFDEADDLSECAAARPSPSRWRRTCSCGRAAATCARRWSFRWRCGSTSCCPSGAIWRSISTLSNGARTASSAPRPRRRHAFSKSARDAHRAREAALLAAVLPNPHPPQRAPAGPGACGGSPGLYEARAARPGRGRLCVRRPETLRWMAQALALATAILYKPGFQPTYVDGKSRSFGSNGCPQTKNIALPARDAPFRRCAQAADLYRGQGFRRTAPPPPHRPQDRHVQGPAGAEGQN